MMASGWRGSGTPDGNGISAVSSASSYQPPIGLFGATVLPGNSAPDWIQGRDNPSLYPIRGGNAEGLMAKLDAARKRLAKVSGQTPKVTLCYEAGYDGFWLARFGDAGR